MEGSDPVNITEFLEARIAEDEQQANAVDLLSSEMETISTHYLPEFADYMLRWQPKSVRAECAAKRAVIALYELHRENRDARRSPRALAAEDEHATHERRAQEARARVAEDALRSLAAVYKDHPDYHQEWAL